MSRILTACLTALFLSLCGVPVACAQETEADTPVDIRPAVSRLRKPAPPRVKPKVIVAVVHKPDVDHQEKPEHDASDEKPADKEAVVTPPAKPKVAPKPAKSHVAAKPAAPKKPVVAKATEPGKSGEAAEPVAKADAADTAAKPPGDTKDMTPTAATTQKPAAPAIVPADFCSNIADIAAETRAKVRADQIASLESDLRTRIGELEAKRAEIQLWVDKQEEIRRRADEAVLAILGKMKSESAAAQIARMEDQMAAAVLMKLGPKIASAILNDMGAAKAARITESMMAQRVASRIDGVKSAN